MGKNPLTGCISNFSSIIKEHFLPVCFSILCPIPKHPNPHLTAFLTNSLVFLPRDLSCPCSHISSPTFHKTFDNIVIRFENLIDFKEKGIFERQRRKTPNGNSA